MTTPDPRWKRRKPTAAEEPATPAWQHRLHEIIFEADTRLGRLFDVALLIAIIASVFAVILESVPRFDQRFHLELTALEWGFTILFSIEYILRMLSVRRPLLYARSFFGMVDLFSILPTYASLFIAGTDSLIVLRALRLLRVFRVFKLAHYVHEAEHLRRALSASTRKITVFLGTVVTLVLILGTLMYLIEAGEESGFTSIPESMYWAIVTLTTVGYGDIAPTTVLGKFVASMVMIMGYGIIAVPTGIVTAELTRTPKEVSTQACPTCCIQGHDQDAKFCKACGATL